MTSNRRVTAMERRREMRDQISPPRDGEVFAQLAGEVWRRQVVSVHQRMEPAGGRRIFAEIDNVINLLEERNLDDKRTIDRGIRLRVRALAREAGLPLPRRVARARNTARLHAVLLDWRETLLDLLRPERLLYPDVHDDS